ncbi:MAG: dCMP deaminase [Myxococcota bacterium]|jgi:dCMP deaminase
MIIGLTGKFAAGKGTVAAYLMTQGYAYHSLSDILREELASRDVAEGRETLTDIGNALRREGGPSVLADRIAERLADGGDHIVDSIRNPAEVERLREVPGFFLLGVDADQNLRFERLKHRARQGDPETFELFASLEHRETHSTDPTSQRLAATFALADEVVTNETDLDALHAQVEAVLVARQ